MELTPEERQRIYEEERVRFEAQERLRQGVPSNASPAQEKPLVTAGDKKILKAIGWFFVALFVIGTWYISIPAIILWYVFKKSALSAERKRYAAIATVAIFAVILGAAAYSSRAPELSLLEPVDGASVQSATSTIKGEVSPASSKVSIEGQELEIKDGRFEYVANLNEERNSFLFTATNSESRVTATVVVNRIFTEEERIQKEKDAEQAKVEQAEREAKTAAEEAERIAKADAAREAKKKAQEEQAAKELAEKKAWDNTKAGKLCAKYPKWEKSDCELVAERRHWIGMSYEMLVESMGSKPNHANPSNYGSGTNWQWCWTDWTPSCFYDNDGHDLIIDAYN